jgi:hypothetical protein
MLEPASTDAGALKFALGATFVTVTEALYALVPPSLSRISPLTSFVPLSVVAQESLALALQSVQVAPSSQLKRCSKPAVVSAEDGSVAALSERLIAEPSFTDVGAVKVALGTTFATAIEAL